MTHSAIDYKLTAILYQIFENQYYVNQHPRFAEDTTHIQYI